MATNNGACKSDTAGTDTLIVFNEVSAENTGISGDNENIVSTNRIIKRFILLTPGTQFA
jgi:hypothetical protein